MQPQAINIDIRTGDILVEACTVAMAVSDASVGRAENAPRLPGERAHDAEKTGKSLGTTKEVHR